MKARFRLGIDTSTGPWPGGERGGQVTVRACTGTGSQTSMGFRGRDGRCGYGRSMMMILWW